MNINLIKKNNKIWSKVGVKNIKNMLKIIVINYFVCYTKNIINLFYEVKNEFIGISVWRSNQLFQHHR